MAEEIISESKLQKDDCVVIVAGSNDVGRNNLRFDRDRMKRISSAVCLGVTQIPVRLDLPVSYEQYVKSSNYFLSTFVPKLSAKFIPIMTTDRDFTRHGQHYNMRGKHKVARAIVEAIVVVVSCE